MENDDEGSTTLYMVTVPIAGQLCVEVEAASEEEAIQMALNSDPDEQYNIEWEMLKHIVTGNVFWGMCNSIEVEEV